MKAILSNIANALSDYENKLDEDVTHAMQVVSSELVASAKSRGEISAHYKVEREVVANAIVSNFKAIGFNAVLRRNEYKQIEYVFISCKRAKLNGLLQAEDDAYYAS